MFPLESKRALVTLYDCRDMHKSHFMSQTRITLPIVLEHIELPVSPKVVSLRDYLNDPDSAQHHLLPRPKERGQYGPFDPWQLRSDFLTWPAEIWEGFVEMAGTLGPFRISKNDFEEWQRLLREALIRHPREWRGLEAKFDRRKVRVLFEPLPISFVWDGEAPEARIRSCKTLNVIIATIQLDVLSGARFKVCARTDCVNPPFKVETRHKIYCSPQCAHLVAVRNSRARAAKYKGSRQRAAGKQEPRG